MLNASKKLQLQNHVVDVGVNTRKNAQRSAPLAPPVENETITQTSAEVNLKKRKAIDHSKTNPTILEIPKQDAISEDEEIIEDQAIVMGKFTKCQVMRKLTGSPIPATHRAMNALSITSRSTKRAKAFQRHALQESTIKLKALNHDLPIMGECTVKIETRQEKSKQLLWW